MGRQAEARGQSRRPAPGLHRTGHSAAPLRRAAGQPSRCVPSTRRPGGGASMKNILIVAAPEFRHIASIPSFWLTLLILPVALSLGPIAQRFLRDDGADRVIVIDRTGGAEARSIEQRVAADRDPHLLQKLSRYVPRHKYESADPAAPWARHDRWYDEADIARFRASGGLDAALARIDRAKPPDAPTFKPPTA